MEWIVWIGLVFLAIHFLDDYFLQIFFNQTFRKMKISYSKENWKWLGFHCLCYIVGFIPVFWWLKINFLWLIFLFGSHYLIDKSLLVYKNAVTYYPLPKFLSDGIKYALAMRVDFLKQAFKQAKLQLIDQLLHFSVLGIVLLFGFC